MRQIFTFSLATLVIATLLTAGMTRAADEKPKYTIKEVMKGQKSLQPKVVKGEATKEEKEKLLEYYEALPANKPPRGEEASWKKLTEALVAATKDVIADKPGAVDQFKKASACAGCHNAHKPKS